MLNLISALQELARKSPRREVCGLIDSDLNIIPITNVSINSGDFVFDRREYFTALSDIEQTGKHVAAVYHSHPFSSATPTKQDLECQKRLKKHFIIVTINSYRWVPYDTKL